jgi:hypothetical protein
MLNLGIKDNRVSVPQFQVTLWHCGGCDSFISIHSAQIVDAPLCPLCGDLLLEPCGNLYSASLLQFADA